MPIFHIHGDADTVVPLAENSGALARRYRELGGSMRLRIPPGQGHNVWDGFFQCQELVEFVIAHASPVAEREPSPALFREPPMEARPGAFWDWLNGNVDLAEPHPRARGNESQGNVRSGNLGHRHHPPHPRRTGAGGPRVSRAGIAQGHEPCYR